MVFKHLLLGLGGSAVIGGIGYGIYASSQSNSEEKIKTDEQKKVTDSRTNSDDNENSAQREENTDRNNAADLRTGEVDGKKGEKATNTNGTTPGTPPAA